MLAEVTVVRIYLSEYDEELKACLKYLHDEAKVLGVTVFRGIEGYGRDAKIHSSQLLDINFDLPIVIEFFDKPSKATEVINDLSNWISMRHILTWTAFCNL